MVVVLIFIVEQGISRENVFENPAQASLTRQPLNDIRPTSAQMTPSPLPAPVSTPTRPPHARVRTPPATPVKLPGKGEEATREETRGTAGASRAYAGECTPLSYDVGTIFL